MMEAWLCISVMTLLVSMMVAQGGIQNLSLFALFIMASVCFYLSIQPQRTYLELSPEGFHIAWGLHKVSTRWEDIARLHPISGPEGHPVGVALASDARTEDYLGCWQRTVAAPTEHTLRAKDYGTNDVRLYQLMINFRNQALGNRDVA
jgi:hypothetical protein